MELQTRSKIPGWDRIVHMYYEEQATFPLLMEPARFKFLLIQKGSTPATLNGKSILLLAPCALCLTHGDELVIAHPHGLIASCLYFLPDAINDQLTFDLSDPNGYEKLTGTTLFQDIHMLGGFLSISGEVRNPLFALTSESLLAMKHCLQSLDHELRQQDTDFWPCRSRSYLQQLFFILQDQPHFEETPALNKELPTELMTMICYMKEHLNERITLEILSRTFGINRNKINALFKTSTSFTALQYLTNMRLELAALILKDTELPLSEVMQRTGYSDPSYFTKVFKAHYQVTPTQFRYPD